MHATILPFARSHCLTVCSLLSENTTDHEGKKAMLDHKTRQYDIYPIRNPDIYLLLDKAHCAVMAHDEDRMVETLVIAGNARYEQIQIRNDIARFDIYCETGFAFTLMQVGRSVQQKFVLHHPALLAFPEPIVFRDALLLANVSINQLIMGFPFDLQALYDMTANLPVGRQAAAFALARLSIISQIVFTFEQVTVNLHEDPEIR
jgi:hypothetical protein